MKHILHSLIPLIVFLYSPEIIAQENLLLSESDIAVGKSMVQFEKWTSTKDNFRSIKKYTSDKWGARIINENDGHVQYKPIFIFDDDTCRIQSMNPHKSSNATQTLTALAKEFGEYNFKTDTTIQLFKNELGKTKVIEIDHVWNLPSKTLVFRLHRFDFQVNKMNEDFSIVFLFDPSHSIELAKGSLEKMAIQ